MQIILTLSLLFLGIYKCEKEAKSKRKAAGMIN